MSRGPLPRALVAFACGGVLALGRPAHVAAHPFGVSSVSRYLGVEVSEAGTLRAAYVLDFAELPSMLEFARLDPDRDGAVTAQERDAYFAELLPRVFARWRVRVNGEARAPVARSRALEAPPGDRGMPTLRVLLEVSLEPEREPPSDDATSDGGPRARALEAREVTLELRDEAYSERDGVRELRAEDSSYGAVLARELAGVGEGRSRDDAGAANDDGGHRGEPGDEARASERTRGRRYDAARFVFRVGAPAPEATAASARVARERGPAPPASDGAPRVEGPARALRTRASRASLALLGLAACALALRAPGGLRALDARARLLAAVCLSASAAAMPGALARAAPGLLAVAATAGLLYAHAPKRTLRRALAPLALALAWGSGAALSHALLARGALDASVALGLRVALSLAALAPLARSTTPLELADALAGLRLPAALVESTAAAARGLAVLGGEAERLARARRARAHDAGPRERARLFGTLAATLLERGLARSERAHYAMLARGYRGALPSAQRRPLARGDYLLAGGAALSALAAHWSAR